jgi:hypothetical protein
MKKKTSIQEEMREALGAERKKVAKEERAREATANWLRFCAPYTRAGAHLEAVKDLEAFFARASSNHAPEAIK